MAFTNKKIIAGNWKMNGSKKDSWQLVNDLLDKFDNQKSLFQMIICPPTILLSEIVAMLDGAPIQVGAQNCSQYLSGAYTGEISPLMIKDVGGRFVILGHSERRGYFYETNEIVSQKAETAIKENITPIICIGETLEQKELGSTVDVIKDQFNNSIPSNATADNIIVAYEPVWAIGTGKSASVSDIINVMNTIKDLSDIKFGTKDINILYGGSVKPSNASEIASINTVGGVLVGGAALKADDFWNIAKAF